MAFSDVVIAYSVYKIGEYAGNAVRLRRSSDDVEKDFGFDSVGVLDKSAIDTWLDGANGFVVTWYDQSGGGHHLTQDTAGLQPQLIYDVDQYKIHFDGVDDYLKQSTSPERGNQMNYRRMSHSGGNFNYIYDSGTNNNRNSVRIRNDADHEFTDTGVTFVDVTPANEYALWTDLIVSGADVTTIPYETWKNGVSQGSELGSNRGSLEGLTMASRYAPFGHPDMKIDTFIGYTGHHDSSKRQSVETSIESLGGVTVEEKFGGSESQVLITSEGAGQKKAKGGSEGSVSITTEQEGFKSASGGSESIIAISTEGGGEKVKDVVQASAQIMEMAEQVGASASVVISGSGKVDENSEAVQAHSEIIISSAADLTDHPEAVDGQIVLLISSSGSITDLQDDMNAQLGLSLSGSAELFDISEQLQGFATFEEVITAAAQIVEHAEVMGGNASIMISGNAEAQELPENVVIDSSLYLAAGAAMDEDPEAISVLSKIAIDMAASITEKPEQLLAVETVISDRVKIRVTGQKAGNDILITGDRVPSMAILSATAIKNTIIL